MTNTDASLVVDVYFNKIEYQYCENIFARDIIDISEEKYYNLISKCMIIIDTNIINHIQKIKNVFRIKPLRTIIANIDTDIWLRMEMDPMYVVLDLYPDVKLGELINDTYRQILDTQMYVNLDTITIVRLTSGSLRQEVPLTCEDVIQANSYGIRNDRLFLPKKSKKCDSAQSVIDTIIYKNTHKESKYLDDIFYEENSEWSTEICTIINDILVSATIDNMNYTKAADMLRTTYKLHSKDNIDNANEAFEIMLRKLKDELQKFYVTKYGGKIVISHVVYDIMNTKEHAVLFDSVEKKVSGFVSTMKR